MKFPLPPLPDAEERIQFALKRAQKLRRSAVFWAAQILERPIYCGHGSLQFELSFLNFQALMERFEIPMRFLLRELFTVYENQIAAVEQRRPGSLPWKTLLSFNARDRLLTERAGALRRLSEEYKAILRQTWLLEKMPFAPPKNPFEVGSAYVRHIAEVRRVNNGGRRPDLLPYRGSPWRSR